MKNILGHLAWLFNRRRRREQKYKTPPSAYSQLISSIDLPEDLPGWMYDPTLEPALINPYKHYQYWYKGQIHVHSNYDPSWLEWGDDNPNQTRRQVMEAYRKKGYAFISLTAHNLLTPPPTNLEVDEIINILGVESGNWCRHHLLGVGIGTKPLDRTQVVNTCDCDRIQPRINYLRMDRKGIVVVAHPGSSHNSGWTHLFCGEGWSEIDVRKSYGYHGIEIFTANQYALELWDKLLCDGKRVWGFGVDDCHDADDNNYFNFNRSWIVVNSDKEKTDADFEQNIIDNIKRGNFYTVLRSYDITGHQDTPSSGSTDKGPELYIRVLEHQIQVQTDQVSRVDFVYGDIGSHNPVMKEIKRTDSNNTAAFTLVGRTVDWVRVEIRQERNSELYLVVSQPLFPQFYVT